MTINSNEYPEWVKDSIQETTDEVLLMLAKVVFGKTQDDLSKLDPKELGNNLQKVIPTINPEEVATTLKHGVSKIDEREDDLLDIIYEEELESNNE